MKETEDSIAYFLIKCWFLFIFVGAMGNGEKEQSKLWGWVCRENHGITKKVIF